MDFALPSAVEDARTHLEASVAERMLPLEEEPEAGDADENGRWGRVEAVRSEKRGDRYVVHGHERWIAGPRVAAHLVLLARTSEEGRGGRCELAFDGPEENVPLGEGLGMRVAQTRLTYCMHWLGMASRALAIATPDIEARYAFGARLPAQESVPGRFGEAAMRIGNGRRLTTGAAGLLGSGHRAANAVSTANIHVADALHHAVESGMQPMGELGFAGDTPLRWTHRYAPQARSADGASQVHRTVVAGRSLAEGTAMFAWGGGEP